MEEWETLHDILEINVETLNTFGEYVDFIKFPGKNLQIRLVIKKQKENPTDKIIKVFGLIGKPV